MMDKHSRLPATDFERFIIVALFGIFAFVLATPVEAYDFFWHLASGRWI